MFISEPDFGSLRIANMGKKILAPFSQSPDSRTVRAAVKSIFRELAIAYHLCHSSYTEAVKALNEFFWDRYLLAIV